MAESATQLAAVGTTIAGRYTIDELLGRGGSSEVYRVRDGQTGRALALKRGLHLGARGARRRRELLEREFHILAQLAHPSIIAVHDYGVDEASGPYYTMELLEGSDLHARGPLPWLEVCALLRDVASSLAILHSRGLVHRDVSARNVRLTADGRAKLIDFGAMISMGVVQDVVGTPPFVAPEVLQMQALDGRADLYSLGALAYYLLTGRHAYAARRLDDLRDMWRSSPALPGRSVPDLPEALNALVMQLLTLDRNSRALSAPELMTRLCNLAGLPLSEPAQVSQAYLTTPNLVGRERELIQVRKHMLGLARGDGGTLLVQGVAGAGRSRMLDACALEAKLIGALVVRAARSDEREAWETTRTLCAQLLVLCPEKLRAAARRSSENLAMLIPGLSHGAETNAAPASDRNLVIRELRDAILSLAREQRVVIVVDDADHIDEPSAALLAALANKTERHPLMLVLAVDRETKPADSASLRLLRLVGSLIDLEQLSAAQTETLIRSVFGAGPNLQLTAAKVHGLSHGNPRAIMELLQHLVESGLARYSAGTWTLTGAPSERDLPSTLSAALEERYRRLSADAREVCELLCLSDGDGEALSFEALTRLSQHREGRRVFQAFDELVSARVLITDAAHYRFSQRGFLSVIERGLTPEQARLLHAQLAQSLAADGGDWIRQVEHLFAAEEPAAALAQLCEQNLAEASPSLGLLERAIEVAERLPLPARTLHMLRRALLIRAVPAMACASYLKHVPHVLAQLTKDSGYDDYLQLSAAEPGAASSSRLQKALALAQARYDTTPEALRVFDVTTAIQELAVVTMASQGIGVLMLDPSFLASLPSLDPFATLSPALRLIILAGEGTLAWLAGRFNEAQRLLEQVVARLAEPDRAGLNEGDHARLKLSMHYGLGVLEASRGVQSAEDHADLLEQHRQFRVNAWRVRRLLQLSRGNLDEADRCQRRAELLLLQDGTEQAYGGTNVLSELAARTLMDDLLGIQESMKVIDVYAATLPGWRSFIAFGQANCQRLQGDYAGALATLLPALDSAPPGRHPAFGFLAGTHINLLCDLQRHDEAAQRGKRYVELSDREDLSTTGQVVHVATARALTQLGQTSEAAGLLDRVIEVARARGQTGVSIGSMYEARARLANHMGERRQFERNAQLCAAEYRKGNSPFLAAKYARLMDAAQPSDPSRVVLPIALRDAVPAPNPEYLTIQSRMLECVDEQDRGRCALTMLLQEIECFNGYLFGVNGGGLNLLSAWPQEDTPPEVLQIWLERYVAIELTRSVGEATQRSGRASEPGDDDEEDEVLPSRLALADGRRFEPLLLFSPLDGKQVLAAVLVFQIGSPGGSHPSLALRQQIALQLLEHRDVLGAVMLEPAYTETRRR
jgi:hypothetical protein